MRPYKRGDERPAWQATVTINGAGDDLSVGFTFEVKIIDRADAVVLTKSTGITGSTGGRLTVAWAPNDLNLEPGLYTAQLKATRTDDNHEWTITEPLIIEVRH